MKICPGLGCLGNGEGGITNIKKSRPNDTEIEYHASFLKAPQQRRDFRQVNSTNYPPPPYVAISLSSLLNDEKWISISVPVKV